MSEFEQHNDHIEQFFRDKVREHDISYRESDWQNLEKRLDRLDHDRASRRRRYWLTAAAVLICSMLGYFTYENYINIQDLNEQMVNRSTTPKSTTPPGQKQNSPSGNGTNKTGNSSDNLSEQQDNALRKNSGNTGSTGFNHSRQNEVVSGNPAPKNTSKDNSPKAAPSTPEIGFNGITLASCINCVQEKELPGQRQSITKNDLTSYPQSNPVAVQAELPHFLASNSTAKSSVSQKTLSRFSIGLVMSPDFSTTGSISNFTKPGYKMGGTIEYKFSPSFGISLGIMQSDIHYLAEGRDYRPPTGFWTQGIRPYETDGQCLMLDIPITVKYNMVQFSRSRIFTTAGVASYIMLNESYTFDYDTNYAGLVEGWKGKTGTKYWLSNASFSIGYEWDLRPTISLRAEPFIRIPMKRVGWGNVKLYSVGSLISLHYHLK